MDTMDNHKKLIDRIKRAKDSQKKTEIWQDADLSRSEGEQVVREMVLSAPKGHYKIHDRQYGTNLVDTIYELYGWMPSMLVSERILLGLQALHPESVYASFTLGLDVVEIRSPKKIVEIKNPKKIEPKLKQPPISDRKPRLSGRGNMRITPKKPKLGR